MTKKFFSASNATYEIATTRRSIYGVTSGKTTYSTQFQDLSAYSLIPVPSTYTTPLKNTLRQHVSKYHPSMAAAAAAVQAASNQLYQVQLPGGAQVATAGPLLQPFGDGRMQAIVPHVPEATRIKMDRVPATPDIGDEHVRRISEDAGAFHCIDCSFVGATKGMLKAHTQHVHPVII